MAITVDSTTAVIGQASSSTTQTFAHTVNAGSDRILFVVAACRTANTFSGVTYAGNALTKINEVSVSGNQRQSIWYIVAPTTGTNNVVITINSANTGICGGAISFFGASQTGIPDAQAASGSVTTTDSYSQSVTTIADNCWCVMGGRAASGATLTAGANTVVTQPEVAVAGVFLARSSGAKTPAGTATIAMTSATQSYDSVMVSFAPSDITVASFQNLTMMGVGS